MKNPFTKKEMPKRTFAEALKLNFKKKEDKPSAPKNMLEEEVKALRAENEALKAAMSEIAQPQTNSIAKIRAAAQTYIDEVGK